MGRRNKHKWDFGRESRNIMCLCVFQGLIQPNPVYFMILAASGIAKNRLMGIMPCQTQSDKQDA
jgi:hypothetical protein